MAAESSVQLFLPLLVLLVFRRIVSNSSYFKLASLALPHPFFFSLNMVLAFHWHYCFSRVAPSCYLLHICTRYNAGRSNPRETIMPMESKGHIQRKEERMRESKESQLEVITGLSNKTHRGQRCLQNKERRQRKRRLQFEKGL